MNSTTITFKPITNRARCGKWGKHIMCPNCKSISKVYHFSWSGLQCQQCKECIDKLHWFIESN